MLDRDLSDLLVEFSLALGHQAAYPEGHPVLAAASQRLTHAVVGVLAGRPSLTLGIARRQFVIDGVLTDPRNGLLGNLAHRLHRHRAAAVRFDRGITQADISGLLAALACDPRREPGPLGLRPEGERRWPHAEVYPAPYDRLELAEGTDADAEADRDTGTRELQLWLELARAALPEETGADVGGSSHPGVIAAAINRRSREVSYDEAVVGYLMRVAEEVAVGETVEQAWLRRRLSRLIASLEPEALERLLQVGIGEPYRKRFVSAASQTLGADAVLRVVHAAAESAGRGISDNLMLLLRKLAQHAESDAPEIAENADAALRDNVDRLVAGWELEDPNPDAYSSALQGMAKATEAREPSGALPQFELDAADLVRTGLEIGETGPRVQAAAAGLAASGRTRLLTELLATAAQAGVGTDAVWSGFATVELLAAELARQPVDFGVVEALVSRLKEAAGEPLLDALESSQDRSTRWNLLRILGEVGTTIAPAVAARLPYSPWYVQRNLLLLLGRLGSWPEGFSPTDYLTHPDPRVRREAYRLMLDSPGTREAGILGGLSDRDPGILTMVLTTALQTCPAAAVPAVERITGDPSADGEVRVLAVRVLGGAPDPDLTPRLAAMVRQRRWWRRARLAPKSPVLLAVLKVLAESRSEHPDVASTLALAGQHRDPEIRAAARQPGPA
jgi:hypothetical protein